MKNQEANERHDKTAALLAKKPTEVGMRLVSRPNQTVLREWEITLPDELVAALTLNI